MLKITRRAMLLGSAAAAAVLSVRANAVPAEHAEFIEAAFRMRDEAVRAGDQAYGAVLVKDGRIIGFGPSRVVLKKDATAHAEREAIREAQARLGRRDLSGAVLYSSSRPCSQCEAAAAEANVARMIHGRAATDAGKPGGRL
jgi:tRNA(Arg) A34 adenosine deaminase TadA